MKDILIVIWLLPILFMFHDFEEIIFMKPWFVKNKEFLIKKYPKFQKTWAHYGSLSTSSFALGVAVEFILLSIITITAVLTGWYYLWFSAFIVFTIHLIAHCVTWLVFRRYIPVIVTSIICLPICCYFIILFFQLNNPDIRQAAVFSIIGIVLFGGFFLAIHKNMVAFNQWLTKYQNNKKI